MTPPAPRSKKVTASDVAAVAGVSKWTVSRAFTEGAQVAPEVRERILKISAELGYSPNLLARSLSTRKTHIIGLVVDDAIIAVEMMAIKMEQGFDRIKAASYAWTSTAFPMLTGTLITAAGFLPIATAQSGTGEYTRSIFQVVTIALLASWVAAVMFVPYLGEKLLPDLAKIHAAKHGSGDGQPDPYATPFYQRVRRLVEWCVRRRKTVIVLTVGLFVASVMLFKFVPQQFFPASNRLELMVDLKLAEGASLANTTAEVKRLEAMLKDHAGIDNYVAYVGTGSPRFYLPLDQQLPAASFAQFVVLAKTIEEREALRTWLIDTLNEQFPSLRSRVTRLENGPPVGYPVQFRVTGLDVAGVRAIADQVKEVMRSNPNTVGVNDNWNESIKVVRIDLDQDKLRALGVTSQTVMRAANTILTGTTVGQFRDGNKLIDMVVRQPIDERSTIEALSNANMPIANGKSVPLSQLATIKMVWEPGVVWRERREWAVTVQSDVVDGIQGPTVSAQIMPKLSKIIASLPPGYKVELAGAAADSGKAQDSIAANVPLVIFIIFTLLMLQLHSFSRSLLVFLTGPLGVAGAAMALLILQRPFGFVAQLGVIALFGMIIRNSVILIDQIEHDIGAGVDPWNAVVESAVRRFRPIILTAAAAVLAMIPLSRSVFWGPMAVAIMGGLIIATGLTLLFLPALYAAWFKVKKRGHSI